MNNAVKVEVADCLCIVTACLPLDICQVIIMWHILKSISVYRSTWGFHNARPWRRSEQRSIHKQAVTNHYKSASFTFHHFVIDMYNKVLILIKYQLKVEHCVANTFFHILIPNLPIFCFYKYNKFSLHTKGTLSFSCEFIFVMAIWLWK